MTFSCFSSIFRLWDAFVTPTVITSPSNLQIARDNSAALLFFSCFSPSKAKHARRRRKSARAFDSCERKKEIFRVESQSRAQRPADNLDESAGAVWHLCNRVGSSYRAYREQWLCSVNDTGLAGRILDWIHVSLIGRGEAKWNAHIFHSECQLVFIKPKSKQKQNKKIARAEESGCTTNGKWWPERREGKEAFSGFLWYGLVCVCVKMMMMLMMVSCLFFFFRERNSFFWNRRRKEFKGHAGILRPRVSLVTHRTSMVIYSDGAFCMALWMSESVRSFTRPNGKLNRHWLWRETSFDYRS